MRPEKLIIFAAVGVAFIMATGANQARQTQCQEKHDPTLQSDRLVLEAGKFDRLSPGMSVWEAAEIVGPPDFIQTRATVEEHLYVFPNEYRKGFQFVTLFFDRNNRGLVKGVLERPIKEDTSNDGVEIDPDTMEKLKTIAYIG